ncbi:hypothetical protein R3P38DRAFT_2954897 [Favolaschia claudopus]|uniref:Uncharacterized protein n=1 Tax=Favolaschia claudopus TaxID=2862362 RepID=A0AAW0BBS4_9AGAR
MSHLSTSTSGTAPKTESGFTGPASLSQNAPFRSNFDHASSVTSSARRRPPSRRSQRAIPSPLKASGLLAGFLPIPPVLSVIYLACGHAALRAAHPAHYGHVPLTSSVRAGAVGGAVLAVPLALFLYILLFPTKPPDPEDFFDDDEDTVWPLVLNYGTYAICAILTLLLGSISGALGTVCLPSNIMLSAAEAAAAGIVGASIICGGLAMVAVFAFVIWLDFLRPKSATPTTDSL